MTITFIHESEHFGDLTIKADIESDGFFDVSVYKGQLEYKWEALTSFDQKCINSWLEFEHEKYQRRYFDFNEWRHQQRVLNEIHAETMSILNARLK